MSIRSLTTLETEIISGGFFGISITLPLAGSPTGPLDGTTLTTLGDEVTLPLEFSLQSILKSLGLASLVAQTPAQDFDVSRSNKNKG